MRNRLHGQGLAVLLLLIASCSGIAGNPQPTGSEHSAVIHAGDVAAGIDGAMRRSSPPLQEAPFSALPAPEALEALARGSSFTLEDGRRSGSEFNILLPSQRIAADGSACLYQPNFSPGNSGLERMAYAVYSFNLPDYEQRYVEVTTDWSTAPGAGKGFIALGNFDSGRWEWYGDMSGADVHIEDFSPYISDTDLCFVVVAASGTAICRLAEVRLYTPQPPTAMLNSDLEGGTAPQNVFFDGSGSTDADGSVQDYEWDLDGDGEFGESGAEAMATGQSTLSHEFSESGAYDVKLRVTDNDGLIDTASRIINIGLAPNDAPIALLQAVPEAGPAPLEVSFDASLSSDPDGSIVAWEWDFDGDLIYGEAENGEAAAANKSQPDPVLYADIAVYNPNVRITDNGGAMDSASIEIRATDGSVLEAVLEADVTEGDAPLSVSFSGVNSQGPITDYEWDFDGDGVFNEAGPELLAQGNPSPDAFNYANPQLVSVSLKVSESALNTDTATLLITAHGWVNVEMPESGVYPAIGVINGHPAICYHNQDSDLGLHTCRYSYSNSPLGDNADDWSEPVSIETAVLTSGWQSSLQEIDGAPTIAYFSTSTQSIYFERASSSTGAQQVDWAGASVLIDSGSQTYWGLRAADVNGNPAIAFYRNTGGSTGELRYVRSSTATGMAGADWTDLITVDSTTGQNVGHHCWLSVINGTPAISYGDDGGGSNRLKYAHSSTPGGGSAGDWTKVTISTNEAVDDTVLLTVAGNPAIFYSTPGNGQLKYRRASGVSGNTEAEWTGGAFVTLPISGFLGSGLGANIVNGHPALLVRRSTNPAEVRYLEAISADGALSTDWTSGIDELADQAEPHSGEWLEMTVLPGGQPVVIARGRFVAPTELGVRYSVKL